MRSGAPVKSPSCAPAIRGAATRPESGVQVEKATITASAARDVRHMGQGLEWGDAPTCTGPAQASTSLVQPAPAGELFDQIADHGLGVTEQHPGVVLHVQLVVDAGKARVLAALDRQDGLGFVGVDDRHAVDRTALGIAGGRVHDRFMARHMMIERIRPLEPSSAPAVTRSLLLSTKPIATAESPA